MEAACRNKDFPQGSSVQIAIQIQDRVYPVGSLASSISIALLSKPPCPAKHTARSTQHAAHSTQHAKHVRQLEEHITEHRTVWPGSRADLPHFIMSYFLFADSELAKTFQGPHGPDILVGDDTRIGRSVSGRDSCKLPTKWAQVSGNHCKIFYTSLKV